MKLTMKQELADRAYMPLNKMMNFSTKCAGDNWDLRGVEKPVKLLTL
ncbi:hypothetical protein IAQ67_15240 [Paenibacillus peoriae]|uniref:Uncharacterized protein n=1 Tax=Paenibacillus peoriae TaxID=59893 RepID=A0A7H0Y2F8_9BACL|nr:hypothetical protein [Paenibacillus peoriae]QNR65266.1 hypothetical protein IAQ67_15240 [Paenibacillus peoriae]